MNIYQKRILVMDMKWHYANQSRENTNIMASNDTTIAVKIMFFAGLSLMSPSLSRLASPLM